MIGVALNLRNDPHYVDHLGVLAAILGIPYLLTDEQQYSQAKKYYPSLHAKLKKRDTLSSDYIFSHFDTLFLSEYFSCKRFEKEYQPLEQKYQKKIRIVHCPHGFSDKGYYLRKVAFEDIALIYGENMKDLLRDEGVFHQMKNYVITGNYRYLYYKQHKEFYDSLVEKEVFSKFERKQKTLLYAPTWQDSQNATSFFEAIDPLLKHLPSHFNLIVKLHPNLSEDHPGSVFPYTIRYEKAPNILIIDDIPVVYPLLARVDAYIGDMSSIGYDFLAFNKPMFFFNPLNVDLQRDRRGYLYQCGKVIHSDAIEKVYEVIEKNMKDSLELKVKRKYMYHYTFGEEKSFDKLKEEIIDIVTKS